MKNPPGPLGPKACLVALAIALLNIFGTASAFADVPTVVVVIALGAASYAWVFVLQTIVRVLLGGVSRAAQ